MSMDSGRSLGSPGGAEALITVSRRMGAEVAALRGEIDISNISEVRDAMVQIPDLGIGLVVDLSAVEFMDSSAISLLHELSERVRQRGERVIVVCPPTAPPRRMLELSGLDQRVPLVERLPEAVEILTRPLPGL